LRRDCRQRVSKRSQPIPEQCPKLLDHFTTVAAMWQRQWEQVTPFFAYPPEVRRIVYTTNAIESMHMQLRKIVKNRGHFPSDEAASKLLYLALRNIEKDWKMPPITWRQAVNQFAILFGERFTSAIN
ncbi:transposase, partial [Burkholderia pseudomallei]